MLNGSRVAMSILRDGTATKKYDFSETSIKSLMLITDCLMAQQNYRTLTDCHWFYDGENNCVEPTNVKTKNGLSWLREKFLRVSAQEKTAFMTTYPTLEKVADAFSRWNESEILDFVRGIPMVSMLKMSDSRSIHPLDYFHQKRNYIKLPEDVEILRPKFQESANPPKIISNDCDNIVPFKRPLVR